MPPLLPRHDEEQQRLEDQRTLQELRDRQTQQALLDYDPYASTQR